MPVEHPDFGKLELCTCKAEALAAKRWREGVALSGMGPGLAKQTFANFRRERQPVAYELALEFVADLGSRRWLAFLGGTGTGKCVAADEPVLLADGSWIAARKLVEYRNLMLPTINDGVVVPARAHAEWNAIEPVLSLRATGMPAVVRNGDHPFYAAVVDDPAPGKRRSTSAERVRVLGWTALRDITPGMLVAVPDVVPAFGPRQNLPDDHVLLLAYLIADGGGGGQTGVWFSKSPGRQLDEFRGCVERAGLILRQHGKQGWRVVRPSRKGGGENTILSLMRRHGLQGKVAREKFVPEELFWASDAQIGVFLSRLMGCDGWAYTTDDRSRIRVEVGYNATSERLATEVHRLLRRLGIGSRLRGKTFAGKPNYSWCVEILDPDDVLRFSSRVGLYGKEEKLRRVALAADEALARKGRRRWHLTKAPEGTHWEKVEAVDYAGVAATVAIEVAGTGTFVGDYYEHNSHLLAAICNGMIELGRQPLYWLVSDLVIYLQAGYGAGDFPERLARIKDADVLLLDEYDIGLGQDQGARERARDRDEKMFAILNHRLNHALPVALATNGRLEQFPPRLASRLSDATLVDAVTMRSGDYRLEK